MGSENGVRYFKTQLQLQFDLENVVRYLEKRFWLFRTFKIVVV